MADCTKVKLAGIDEADGSFFSLEFESYVVSVEHQRGKRITRFSNGCVLVQTTLETIALDSNPESLEVHAV